MCGSCFRRCLFVCQLPVSLFVGICVFVSCCFVIAGAGGGGHGWVAVGVYVHVCLSPLLTDRPSELDNI